MPSQPYPTSENIPVGLTYDVMLEQLNALFKKNTVLSTETDNVIKQKNPIQLPTLPDDIPNAMPSKMPNYNFMRVINKSEEDDNITTIDVSNDDTYNLIIQQNTMYIVGSLACASLLIASIFISKQE